MAEYEDRKAYGKYNLSLIMPNGDPREVFFLSHPHTQDRSLYCAMVRFEY